MEVELRDRMFQYYDGFKTAEDTELITAREANELWEKHYEEARDNLKEGLRVQMVIWKNCNTTTDYSTEEKSIDHYDCVVEGKVIYRIKKELVK